MRRRHAIGALIISIPSVLVLLVAGYSLGWLETLVAVGIVLIASMITIFCTWMITIFCTWIAATWFDV